MNSRNSPLTVIIIACCAVLGLYVVLSILLSGGNGLAKLCFYLLIAGGIWGLLAPRSAFYLWIISCGYTDLLKRVMVVFGNIEQTDLYYVLGIPPIMFAAITVSLVVGGLSGSYVVRMRNWWLFVVGIIIMLVAGIISAKAAGGSPKEGIQGMINGGLYSLLIFVVPVMFRRGDEVLRVLRFSLWVMLPVAIYGIVQQIWGFQPFEVAYLRTGLSIEIKQLFTERVRAFSTLNSPTALASLSAVLMVLAWFLARLPQPAPREHRRWLGSVSAGLILLCNAGALIASTGRAGVIALVVGLLSSWCFLTRMRTAVFYFTGAALFLILIAVSPWLLDHLVEAMDWTSSRVNNDSISGQLAVVGTYSDRLHGFAYVLRNPTAYSLFGIWDGNWSSLPTNLYHHDLISASLLRFGVVPNMIILIAIMRLLTVFHRKLCLLEDRNAARFMAMALGQMAGLLAVSALTGNVLSVFPVNAYFWLFAGTVILMSEPAWETRPEEMRNFVSEMESLAGRTPGCSRFGGRKRAAS